MSGLAARRALVRWSWRMLRREWRQQTLVLALLTLAVAATVGGVSAVHSMVPLGDAARWGTANQAFTFEGLDARALEANTAALRRQFGTVDVIGRRYAPVPGSSDVVEFRAQDPRGAYGASMLALRQGRYPAGPGEVAVTASVARTFGLRLGSRLTLADDDREVVGMVENPNDLHDGFALVHPAHAGPLSTVTALVRSAEQNHSIPAAREDGYDWSMADQFADEQQVFAAVAALGAAAVAMVLVALVAAAGFAVVARRRRRRLGVLAAIGASRRQLGLVMLADGAMVGAVAAVAGAALGLLGWAAAVPYLETAVGARLDRSDVLPWWLIVTAMLLALGTATAAAWWPARTAARIPVALALSGRPSPPGPVRRSAVLASVLIVSGVACLAAADRENGPLVAAGTVATVLGVLATGPAVIRALAAAAGHAPVTVRLALRDLARHQARSGAALAAISLASGIAVTVIVVVTSAERTADAGNLSEHQLLITERGKRIRELVTVRSPGQLRALDTQVRRITAALDDPAVTALEMAVDPSEAPHPGRGGMENAWRHAVQVGDGARTARPGPLFVATPEILALYRLAPAPGTDVLTVRRGEIGLRLGIEEEPVANVQRIDVPAHSSAPTSLITSEGLRRRGWETMRAGWLVTTGAPLTSGQIADVHSAADTAGLQVEYRDGVNLQELRSLRTGATAAGAVMTLGVLAMTVGLIRAEAAGDLRILTAAGATATIRRVLTASTACALATGGVALGVCGAYLGLAAGFSTELDALLPPPVPHLLAVGIGVPLAAALAGWLLGGRQPSAPVHRSP
ncbi:FtsX-like permease family protein [Planobispora takensis]|uniref:ABC3 transporter permease C-terminal domain-containing protein n=1 Tax=Planobispora takensis TaxID=1367882 RepID=A0A8J3WR50_9ACTN|nr:FtsX-like permease family protein [Planobispora takensis]GIH98810.1 hypothetical protein Pta02_08190 [Planobispora takensis]